MGTTRDKSDEEFSVIGDKGDIGFIDLENCRSACTYNPNSESDIVIISVPFPLVEGKKPQSVIVGETIVDSITIKNTTNGALNLWSVKIYDSKPDGSFTISLMEPPTSSSNLDYIQEFLESFSLEDRVLRPGQTLTVWLSCKPKEIGLHTSAVHFTVGDDNETIERIVFLLAEDRISQSLASKQPYNKCRRKKQMAFNAFAENSFVRGSRPAKASTRVFKRRIPLYPIPNDLRELVESKQIPDAVREGLTKENYTSYFKNLLIMEEIKMEKDMRDYDMECVTMRSKGQFGQFLTLEVPGLAERRPSLVYSDFILAKPVSEGVPDTGPPYQGIIHRVEAEEVYLKFDPEFHRRHRADNVYNVQFTYNRINMRRFYQAVEAAERLESGILFPSVLGKSRVIELTQLVPISCMLNEEQMNSIEMILGCRGGAPYVIHGPPGTGKTKTVVEAVLQLYRNFKNARILVCTPSNSAADHILERLLGENTVEVQDNEIFRLNALTRTCDDIKEDYIKFCFVEGSIFKCPDISVLMRYRIIISTYACASLLYCEGIKRGHFSHIFLDEAGQASEPETMVPLSTLCRRDTVVVLAGDPMQLGPVIFSQEAEMYGLGKSYLERLFEFNCYGTGNENYVTRLVRNYRCHPEILHLPSELFYNGELIACKNDEDITSMTWVDILPNKEFPVLFLGIQGLDEREGSNPSWFNRIEASKVVEIINNLTGNMGLVEQDIGVITPYRQQVLKIRNTLERLGMFHIKVGSVEQFQGQERKVIIISTVRSTVKHNEFDRIHYLGFLSNPRRFNVAISRARSLLIVIGNPHIICKDTYWNKLLWRCSDNGSYQGCFLPEREDIPDEFTVANNGDYGTEDRLEPSETALCGQDSFPEDCEQDSFPREWGQESYPREWDQESYRREWVQESFPTEEIPAPVLDEAEWSDGWK